MTHAYESDGEGEWRRIHANGERTHVIIHDCGDTYGVVAFDVDPREYAPVAADCVAYTTTRDEAEGRAYAWMEANPRGVLGGAEESTGWVDKLIGWLKQLDQAASSANADVETKTEDSN